MALLEFNNKGIYCQRADVYIDPWKKVNKALITHGHSDHARPGNLAYLATSDTAAIMRQRLGLAKRIKTIEYGEKTMINGVQFSFHPAGHVLGSAQIRVEYKGEIWVASGDYKIQNDFVSQAFEPIKCHHYITESTFGLPFYHWEDQKDVFKEIGEWHELNKSQGISTVMGAYSLGKAQRILMNLPESIEVVYTHGAIENINDVYRNQGVKFRKTIKIDDSIKPKDLVGQFVICTPGMMSTAWMDRFENYETGSASGWMMTKAIRRRRSVDRGFVLSDHADWNNLNYAIKESGASNIYVTHGFTKQYAKYLIEQGYNAIPVSSKYIGETPIPDAPE